MNEVQLNAIREAPTRSTCAEGQHMTTTPAMPELLPITGYIASLQDGALNVAVIEYAKAYALATLQAQQAAVSDEQIRHDANLPFVEDEQGAEWVTLSPAMFARAVRRVLALRPQAESEARRAAQEQLYAERERHTAEVKRLQAEIGRLQSLRPQAVPMTEDEIQSAFLMWLGQDSWRVIGAYYMQGARAAEAHHFGITAQGAQTKE